MLALNVPYQTSTRISMCILFCLNHVRPSSGEKHGCVQRNDILTDSIPFDALFPLRCLNSGTVCLWFVSLLYRPQG